MIKLADLHTHTTASDGTYTPVQLIIAAKNKNLAAIGVTDHETVSGLKAASEAAAAAGIEFVPGIEIAAGDSLQLHILGYFIDPENSGLAAAMKQCRYSREIRNREIIRKLRDLGIEHDTDSLPENTVITRANIARLLVDNGHCRDINEAFGKYLGENGKAYVKRERMSAESCIELIHKSGGLAFLAHLNQINADRPQLTALVSELKEKGLDGIEGYYPEYSPEFHVFCSKLAGKNSLLISGGSDFHGENKANPLGLCTGDGGCYPYELYLSIKKHMITGL